MQHPWMLNGNPFAKLEIRSGHYYPRIARPIYSGSNVVDCKFYCPAIDEDNNFRIESVIQFSILTENLIEICKTIHPIDSHMNVYGHDIMNLLILTCTEIEIHFKGIFSSNRSTANNMKDYFKLNKALKLCEYEIKINNFPWLSEFIPFKSWKNEILYKSLDWYTAYNDTKHNRGEKFHTSNLNHAFSAICALYVILCAQFGSAYLKDALKYGKLFFSIKKRPQWDIKDYYISSKEWIPENFPF